MRPIVIIDYEMGNLASVQNAFRAVGCPTEISADPAAVAEAAGVVLPGVGAFANGMRNLAERGLIGPLKAYAAAGRPLLGICVGLQLLFEEGEEFGLHAGLGLMAGRITRLPASVKLPQMGWNTVAVRQPAHPIFEGLPASYYAYFDHSYAADGVDAADVAATTAYGRRFPCVVARANLVGIQFHPEKSSRAGLQMLTNFGRIVWRLNSTLQST